MTASAAPGTRPAVEAAAPTGRAAEPAGEVAVDYDSDPLLWPLGLFAGLLPLVMTAFLVSVIANRLIYLGWGLAAGTAYYLVLRQSFVHVWHPARTVGGVALVYAAAVAGFGWVGQRHFRAFDEGFRAFLWERYHPAITAPGSAYRLAVGLAVLGVVASLWGWWRERRRAVTVAG